MVVWYGICGWNIYPKFGGLKCIIASEISASEVLMMHVMWENVVDSLIS
jgi:hypothetical protein